MTTTVATDLLPCHHELTPRDAWAIDQAAERVDLAAARGLNIDKFIHAEAVTLARLLGGTERGWADQLWLTQRTDW